jgi:hypothetical protein
MDILRNEDMYAIQIDLFDNRPVKDKSLAFAVRIETDKTAGKWFHMGAQISAKRAPSQTKRYLKTNFDVALFNNFKGLREDLSLSNENGFDFTPVIATFYEKNNKAGGILPSVMGLVWKEREQPWQVLMNVGYYQKAFILEPKSNAYNKKIYYAFERNKYNDDISFRKGF